jgi:hypothetical protein
MSIYETFTKLAPPNIFQEDKMTMAGLLSNPRLATQVKSQNASPFIGLPGTHVTFKIRDTTIRIYFSDGSTGPVFPDPATDTDVVNEINATSALYGYPTIATSISGVVTVYDPDTFGVDILEGNSVLGFFEPNAQKVLLKVMAPTLDELKTQIQHVFDVMDLDTAPVDFQKQLGALLGYTWNEAKDTDMQVKLIKEFPDFIKRKGSIPSIERIVRLHGGTVSIFEPYPYIARFEEMVFDGNRVFPQQTIRTFYAGQVVTTFFSFELEPFQAADLNNTTLVLRLGTTLLQVLFTGLSGALTAAAVVSYINAAIAPSGPVASSRNSQILLSAPSEEDLVIVSGNTTLGFFVDQQAGFRFIDMVNAPFEDDDVFRNVYIPDIPGPIEGFRVTYKVSNSELVILQKSPGDHSSLLYQLVPRDPIADRFQDRSFWHDGVYVVRSNIPSSEYRKEFFELVHPAGRVVYFDYLADLDPIDAVPVISASDVLLYVDIMVRLWECGMTMDEGPGFDLPDGNFDGCQNIFGVDVIHRIESITDARRRLDWSQLFYWEDLNGPLFFIPTFVSGLPWNVPVFRPDGHIWSDLVVDVIPPLHVLRFVIQTSVTRTLLATETYNKPGDTTARALLVNEGGVFNKTTNTFTGGTDYLEGVDWEVSGGGQIDWILTGASPATSSVYQVFYSVDPWNPVV